MKGVQLRRRRIGEVLIEAWEIYRRNAPRLLALVAIVVLPLSIGGAYLRSLFRHVEPTWAMVSVAIGEGLLFGVVALLAAQVLTAALTRAVLLDAGGRTFDLQESYSYGLRRVGSVLLVSVLVTLSTIGGFLLLVIPGFIVMVRLIVSVPILVLEDRRGTDALRRSWALVRGSGWRVFGTLLLAGLLTGLVTAILTVPLHAGWFARGLLEGLGAVLTIPYTATVIVLTYIDLRVRQESFDRAMFHGELEAAGRI